MKKLFLMFAVAGILVSCGEVNTAESTTVDSTACDTTKCDTTHTACHTDSALVDSVKH